MFAPSIDEEHFLAEVRRGYLTGGGDEKWLDTIHNEARFCLSEIPADLQGKDILEIGCGAGMHLALLSLRLNRANVTGIDPLSPGFARMKALQKSVNDNAHGFGLRFQLIPVSIEEYEPPGQFDFIFSHNVFEHLDDWRICLERALKWLKPGGTMLIFCPNYTVPYESHFGLPTIMNKRITRMIFQRQINRFERDNNCTGLWKSLNFIKYNEIVSCIDRRQYSLCPDKEITLRLFSRLKDDLQFRERHRLINWLAGFLNMIKVPMICKLLPAFIQPYIKLYIRSVG